MTPTSPYLDQPHDRTVDEVMDRKHRNNLIELLCTLANEDKPQRYRDAVDYAIEALHDRHAERIRSK